MGALPRGGLGERAGLPPRGLRVSPAPGPADPDRPRTRRPGEPESRPGAGRPAHGARRDVDTRRRRFDLATRGALRRRALPHRTRGPAEARPAPLGLRPKGRDGPTDSHVLDDGGPRATA